MGKSQGPAVIAQTAGDTATGSASPRHGVSRDEATTETLPTPGPLQTLHHPSAAPTSTFCTQPQCQFVRFLTDGFTLRVRRSSLL